MARVGRPPTCTCGECPKCKRAAYMREWWRNRTPEQKRATIRARDPERVRASDRRKMEKRRREGTPEQKLRIAARRAVSHALTAGRLTREPCEICGTTENVHAHHDDYSKPLDVRWLCRDHHDALHQEATMDLNQLIGGPGSRAVAEANQRLIDETSADNECPHGFLPGDADPSCGCWRPMEIEDLAA